MKKVNHWLLAGLGVIFFVGACKVVTDSDGGEQGLRSFKLGSNEISGWTEVSCFDFNLSNCHQDAGLNGGAEDYTEEGMVEGFRQIMDRSGLGADIRIMDFGDSANASRMFVKESMTYSDKQLLANYNESIAAAQKHLSGVYVCAHFGKFYFELEFTGYSNESDAKSTAESFIETYESKFKNLK